MGAALAMFVTFTPTVGFQMVLVVFIAWLLRANKAIGVPIVWLSNPATIVPIYYSCYEIGRVVLQQESIGAEWWGQLKHPPVGWLSAAQFYWSRFLEIAGPVWMGSVLVGSVAGYITYYSVYHVVRVYRLKRWGQTTKPKHVSSRSNSSEPAQ